MQAIAIVRIAEVSTTTVGFATLFPGFVMGGTGMALVFAPAANAVLSAVKPAEAGEASGATNAIREVGGVLGVAVLAAMFSGAGGFETPQVFVDGLVPARSVGAAVLVAGALAALLVPGERATAAPRGRARPRRGVTPPRATDCPPQPAHGAIGVWPGRGQRLAQSRRGSGGKRPRGAVGAPVTDRVAPLRSSTDQRNDL